jgi:hypothetical protein
MVAVPFRRFSVPRHGRYCELAARELHNCRRNALQRAEGCGLGLL